MRAEIIAVGDELTSGQRLDTNSQWLSQRLGELGLPVIAHTTVSDDLAVGMAALQIAAERATVIVMTGGLGPTADDLTRQCIAEAAGVPLVLDPPSLEHIRSLFARRQRPMPESNRLQAEFPAGSRIIANPHGTAPGIDFDLPRSGGGTCRLFALPGVPAEMKEMWEQTVAPALQNLLPGGPKTIVHRQIKCFGVGESDLEQMLPDLIRRGRDPSVGITVHRATITLRITARGTNQAECHRQIAPVENVIRECLGDLVFGEEHDELEHVVLRQLAAIGQTVATAECGTAGRLAWWLARAEPTQRLFRGGVVLPHRELEQWLPPASHGSDPAQFASAMAQQARLISGANFGLAVGPFPDPASAPQETLYAYAVCDQHQVRLGTGQSIGHPEILVDRAAKQALNLLRQTLRQPIQPG